MTNFKHRPIRDPDAALAYWMDHHQFCVVCEMPGQVHHIKYKSAGGDDCPENFLTLCNFHHTNQYPESFHTLGARRFVEHHRRDLGHANILKIAHQYPHLSFAPDEEKVPC